MAPADKKDGAEKYKHMSLDELKEECGKRKIKFDESSGKDALIDLLVKDDRKPPNWGKIYAQLMFHYHMDYDSIKKRTLPQIQALNNELPEQIQIGQFGQLSLPGLFGGALDNPAPSPTTGKPPKLSEFMAFCNEFNGI